MIYFTHDSGASSDDKVMALRIEHGGAAVDAYWAVLEKMYAEETDLVFCANRPETKAVSYRLCVDVDTLKTYLDAMVSVGLLDIEDACGNDAEGTVTVYYSTRVREVLSEYRQKKETARRNGKMGGRKPTGKPKANRRKTKSVSKGEPTRNQTPTYIEEEIEEEEGVGRVRARGLGMAPNSKQLPTLDEVRSYFATNCLRGDPDGFFAHYDGQGWVKGNGLPVDNWESVALSWSRRQAGIDAERSARGEPTAEQAAFRPVKSDEERLAELEAELAAKGWA
ncbi:MAG: DUF4373 domain-containing protein [Coriobacteriaceae bacterium]|nr:DUF4373 domain-containing protein [Coriobacteriaceae bacterium]